jgi:hypothetical protein
MFAMAIERQPFIIFMEGIDSLLSSRSANKHVLYLDVLSAGAAHVCHGHRAAAIHNLHG